MTTRFSEDVQSALNEAGWAGGRDAHDLVSRWTVQVCEFPFLPRALEVLREFGGLVVQRSGPGVDHARGGLAFDPTALVGEADRFQQFTPDLGPLTPLGETADGHAFVVMDESGRVLGLGLDGVIRKLGDTIEEALDRLVSGRRWVDLH